VQPSADLQAHIRHYYENGTSDSERSKWRRLCKPMLEGSTDSPSRVCEQFLEHQREVLDLPRSLPELSKPAVSKGVATQGGMSLSTDTKLAADTARKTGYANTLTAHRAITKPPKRVRILPPQNPKSVQEPALIPFVYANGNTAKRSLLLVLNTPDLPPMPGLVEADVQAACDTALGSQVASIKAGNAHVWVITFTETKYASCHRDDEVPILNLNPRPRAEFLLMRPPRIFRATVAEHPASTAEIAKSLAQAFRRTNNNIEIFELYDGSKASLRRAGRWFVVKLNGGARYFRFYIPITEGPARGTVLRFDPVNYNFECPYCGHHHQPGTVCDSATKVDCPTA
jgi:hypothetical protein